MPRWKQSRLSNSLIHGRALPGLYYAPELIVLRIETNFAKFEENENLFLKRYSKLHPLTNLFSCVTNYPKGSCSVIARFRLAGTVASSFFP